MTMEMIKQIFDVCIIPLLGILTGFLVDFIKTKKTELTDKSKNELVNKYIKMLADTINTCVIATNQTYVNSLKKEEKFDKAAQVEAFERTRAAVLDILSDEAKTYLTEAYGDLNKFIGTQIEAVVNINK